MKIATRTINVLRLKISSDSWSFQTLEMVEQYSQLRVLTIHHFLNTGAHVLII